MIVGLGKTSNFRRFQFSYKASLLLKVCMLIFFILPNRWIEAWDRQRRQYLCQGPSNCVATRDDVRLARCAYYDNRTLNDVSILMKNYKYS